MALTATEHWSLGFVRDTDGLAWTTDDTDARWWNGFVRDPDGRLVISTAGSGAYQTGYERDPAGLLVLNSDGKPFAEGSLRRWYPMMDYTVMTLRSVDTDGLTGEVDNWGAAQHRVLWYNSYQDRWDAIVPAAAPPAAGQSDWTLVKDINAHVPDYDILVDTRPNARPDTVWDDANKKLYVLMSAINGGGKFYAYTYDSVADTYTVVSTVNGVATGVNVMGGNQGSSVMMTANGHLWVAGNDGKLKVTKSTDGGHTWATVANIVDPTNAAGKVALVAFTDSDATNRIGVVCAEDGSANESAVYRFLHIAEDAAGWATAANWTDETSSLTLDVNTCADDDVCAAVDADNNVYFTCESELIGSRPSPDWMLFKRVPGGAWTRVDIYMNQIGSVEHKRATLTIDDTNSEIYVFCEIFNKTKIVYRKAALDSVGDLSTADEVDLFNDGSLVYNTHTPANVTSTSDLVALVDQQTDWTALVTTLDIA